VRAARYGIANVCIIRVCGPEGGFCFCFLKDENLKID